MLYLEIVVSSICNNCGLFWKEKSLYVPWKTFLSKTTWFEETCHAPSADHAINTGHQKHNINHVKIFLLPKWILIIIIFLLRQTKKYFCKTFFDSKTFISFSKSTLISVQYSTRLSMINNRPPYITIRVVKCIPLCNVNVCKITSFLTMSKTKQFLEYALKWKGNMQLSLSIKKSLLAGNIVSSRGNLRKNCYVSMMLYNFHFAKVRWIKDDIWGNLI